MPRLTAMLAALAMILPAAPLPAAPPTVTVYRCTDGAGRLTLRDSPCLRGERQVVRSMLRPTDPPPGREPARPAQRPDRADPVVAQPRVVYVTPARPTYECVTPDGDRYTSGSPEGNPRWVPLWTLGYPVVAMPPRHGGIGGHVEYRGGDTTVRIGGGQRWGTPGVVVAPPVAYAPTGTWIRDACHVLPPAEVCDRLRDRHSALGSRYHSALQSERHEIDREQRSINSRLASECAG